MRALIGLLVVGLMPLGCSKSEPPPPLVAASAPSVAPVASAAPSAAPDPVAAADSATAAPSAAPTPAAKAVPTPADYEVQATAAITPANAAQVLTAIDKEVGQ